MKLAKRAEAISPSPTLAIDAKAKAMKKAGLDIIGFGVGEPDFDTPEHIKEAAVKAIEEGFTKYTAVAGIDELKEAICAKLQRDQGLTYTPQQIIVSSGAKHSLYNAFQVLCDEGDEVLLPSPYWVSYCEQIKLAGGIPVVVETKEDNGFKLTGEELSQAITPKTKVLILNSPSNPTGAVYSKEELETIARILVEKNIFVISDEIYEKLIYDGNQHVSIASFGEKIKDLTIIINGLSKAYSMTGWRIGYAAAHEKIVKAMTNFQSHATSNPTSVAQKAGVEALNGPEEPLAEMLKEFKKRRNYMVENLNKIPGITCLCPGGAFYVFPNVSAYYGKTIRGKKITDSTALAEVLLEEGKVALVPGEAFGVKDYLRLSYATSLENIMEGIRRMEALLQEAID